MEGTRQAEYRKGKLRPWRSCRGLKATLKRGALVAAANWPLVAVQFVAESTLKVLLGVPVVGGIFLVVLLLGANADELLAGDLREIVAQVFGAMRQNVAALVAFSIAFAIVLLGGSALTFVIKGGTVSLLAAAEAQAGPIERPPLSVRAVRRANVVAIDPFLDGCQRLWRRYVRLGACLLGVYAVTAVVYLAFVIGGYRLVENSGVLLGWTIAAAIASSVLIVWITLVNFFYLLTQMVVAIEDVSVRNGVRRVAALRPEHLPRDRRDLRRRAAAGGDRDGRVDRRDRRPRADRLIPLLGLAVLPLQIAAWLVRGFVFQYLALAALGAYLTHYRHYAARHLAPDGSAVLFQRSRRFRGNGSHDQLRQVPVPRRRADAGVGDPADGHGARAEARHHLVRARVSGARHVSLAASSRRSRASCSPAPTERAAVRTDARLSAAARGHRRHHGRSAARPPRSERLLVTTGSQQGLDLVARVLVDPGDVMLVELPTYTGAITAFRNVQAQMVGVPQEADGIDLEALDEIFAAPRRQGRRVRFLYVVPNFQNPTGLLIGLEKRRALLEWAARRDMLIVEDDPYRELFFEDSATRGGRASDQGGRRRSGASSI